MRAMRGAVALTLAAASAAHVAADEPAAVRRAATERSGMDAADESGRYRAPLLREGSHVVRVHARIERNGATGALSALIDATDRRQPGHAMVLLPSSYLDELESMLATTGATEPHIEVTGQIFVYHQSNYLLLAHPPVLLESPKQDAIAPAAPEPAAAGADAPAPPHDPAATNMTNAPSAPSAPYAPESPDASDLPASEAPVAPAQGADSVRDIISSLEESLGPVARRPDLPVDLEDASGEPVAPELRLVDRRGKVRRTPNGAFVFSFDADADGYADPPMILLPCMLLERLERIARQNSDEATILLSGQVVNARAQSYLLPTAFRLPRERTRIESR